MEACRNGHDPEYIEVRPNGARVCVACRNLYFATKIRSTTSHNNTRKENNHGKRND